ncbi:MAG: DUF3460 family protein [Neisseriales bacterium]|nr:MAG: DUF3460 family protein [Neisseriales bacterium]
MAINRLYRSAYSNFIDRFLATHEAVQISRATLRKTWWQNELDEDTARRFKASSVPKKSYTYE